MFRIIVIPCVLIAAAAFIAVKTRPAYAPPPVDPVMVRVSSMQLKFAPADMTAAEAIAELSKAAGVPIVVDWKGLGGCESNRVNFQRYTITFEDSIDEIFRQAYDPGVVDFDVENGRVIVEQEDALDRARMSWRVYDVRDLLTDEVWRDPAIVFKQDSPEERANYIGVILTGAVLHHYIESSGGHLCIRETQYGHHKIAEFLAMLRKQGLRSYLESEPKGIR